MRSIVFHYTMGEHNSGWTKILSQYNGNNIDIECTNGESNPKSEIYTNKLWIKCLNADINKPQNKNIM